MSQLEVFIHDATLGALGDPAIAGLLVLAMFVGLAVVGGYKGETKLLLIGVGMILFMSLNVWMWIVLLFLTAGSLFLFLLRYANK
jgi:hypothetical protein